MPSSESHLFMHIFNKKKQTITALHVCFVCSQKEFNVQVMVLTHSILSAKQFFGGIFTNFQVFLPIFRSMLDCSVKFTSCYTYIKKNQDNTFMFKKCIIELNKTINLGAKNGPVGWNRWEHVIVIIGYINIS